MPKPPDKSKGPLLKSDARGGESDSSREIPPEFRAALALEITDQKVPLSNEPTELDGDTVLASKTEQTLTGEKRRRTVTKPPGPVSLVEYDTNAKKQVVTRTRTMKSESALATPPDATTVVEQKNLGIKQVIEDVSTVPEVFPENVFAQEIPDVMPQEFRVAVPTVTEEDSEEGTAGLTSLTQGELQHSETQFDAFTKRVRTVFRSIVQLPITLIEAFRGGVNDHQGSEFTGVVTRTRKLDQGLQTPEQGLKIIASTVKNLGDGTSLRETEAIDNFVPLKETIMDKATGLLVDRTKDVVAAGTIDIAGSSIFALDKDRSVKVTDTPNATSLSAIGIKFPGTTNVDIPPELLSITAYSSKSAGAGNYSEAGSYSIAGQGSGGIALNGECQGSAAVIVDVAFEIKQVNGANVPCMHIVFFAAASSSRATLLSKIASIFGSSVADWPKFVPKSCTVVMLGGKTNSRLRLSAIAHDVVTADFNGVVKRSGGARTNGGGIEIDNGVSTKTVHIPPTIHGVINVGGAVTDFASFSSSSFISTGVNSETGSLSGTAEGQVAAETRSFGATSGQSTIPTGGNFLHRLIVEPYLPGYIAIHAEVVTFSDFV